MLPHTWYALQTVIYKALKLGSFVTECTANGQVKPMVRMMRHLQQGFICAAIDMTRLAVKHHSCSVVQRINVIEF